MASQKKKNIPFLHFQLEVAMGVSQWYVTFRLMGYKLK